MTQQKKAKEQKRHEKAQRKKEQKLQKKLEGKNEEAELQLLSGPVYFTDFKEEDIRI